MGRERCWYLLPSPPAARSRSLVFPPPPAPSLRAAPPPPPLPYRQVVIQDGQVLAGTLCKKTLGAAPGGLVHITWMEYGPEAARALLSQVGWVCWAGESRRELCSSSELWLVTL